MGARNTVPADVRAAIEDELLHPRNPPRSRAAIAAEHGVNPRTVGRYATALGIPPEEAWKTDAIRVATEAATDRRRRLRSDLADLLLATEVPRLLDRLAAAHGGEWRKTVIIPGEMGGSEQVDEDDATVARGLKDTHAALKAAVDQTIAIDKHDTDTGDQAARQALGDLFGALKAAAEHGIEPDRDDDPEEAP